MLEKEITCLALLVAKEHVKEPTNWLLPIFVVFKLNEDIRMCVNLRKLNQAIKRELDQMSTKESKLELQRLGQCT